MIEELRDKLHLIDGDSAAACLRIAHNLSLDQVIVNRELIAFGPVPATSDAEEWAAIRADFLVSLYPDDDDWPRGYYILAERDFQRALARIHDQSSVIIWASAGLGDQLLIARFLSQLGAPQPGADRLRIAQFEYNHDGTSILSLGELAPKAFGELATLKTLSEGEVSDYRLAWHAYSSANPQDLIDFLANSHSSTVLDKAMRRLVYRYPDHHTGLSLFDQKLLQASSNGVLKASRVIGQVIGHDLIEDRVGDLYLFKRLVDLGATTHTEPLLSVTGNPKQMRSCQVEITDFGKRVLAGQVNAVAFNGARGWVGGVDLAKLERPVVREGDKLRFG